MNKREKIGIAIVVVLIIILAINIWTRRASKPKVKISCKTACHEIGNNNWIFPGVIPVSRNLFPTRESCISACLARTKK